MIVQRRRLRAFSLGHLRDCLAIAMAASPVYAWLEVHWLGLPPATSAQVRLMTVAALAAGLGLVLARGRDLSLRLLRISPGTSRERVVLGHDMAFMALANGLLAPLFYLAAGASVQAAVQGAWMAMGVSLLTGSANGWAIDALRELSGPAASRRLPEALREGSAPVRCAAIAALCGASLLLVLAAYRY